MSQATRDNLIAAGVLLGVVLAATVLVYLPQRGRLHDLRTEIAQEKARLLGDTERSSAVPAMLRQVQTMRKRYTNFDRRLPKRKELGGFLREISGNLAQENLANQLIEPGSPTRAKLFHTLPIVVRFQGSYLSLASFLKRLEEMERLTQVQRLSISRRSQPDRAAPAEDLHIEVLMNIYFTES